MATVVLIRSRLFPVEHLGSLIDTQGSAVELLQRAQEEESTQASLPLAGEAHWRRSAELAETLARARADVTGWLDRGLDVRDIHHPSYPSRLREVFNCPPLVFVRGQWRDSVDRWSIAVVGTRSPSPEGIRRATDLVHLLATSEYTVVSGLARGIDAVAHRTALTAGGRTLAVMGTGLDHIYPPSHVELSEEIVASGGALITPFFPHQGPAKWTFPVRNAVMSGLSLATVVVEASETSGARMQARLALQHGRSVFLPRSLVAEHGWAHRMVEEGLYGTQAIPVDSASEILDRLEGRAPQPAALAV